MCGVQPKPVDVRPLQDKVQNAAQQCNKQDLSAIKAQVNKATPQMDEICGAMLAGAALFAAFKGAFDARSAPQAPSCGCLQPPSQDLSAAPAGRGLTTSPEGWPKNAIRTAGGYTIVPEGKDAAWKIYGPQQGPQDKALSRVWGDPHVDEADGQRWDFSKSSTFRLPDGTTIDVGTTAEQGRTLSSTLNITNGSDHIQVSGVNSGKPEVGALQSDGFSYRAQVASVNPNRDTFVLGGTGREADGNDRVQWARERGGQFQGVISGTIQNADGHNGYDQVLDRNRAFKIDASLRPDPISQRGAWGNLIRGELAETAGRDLPPGIRDFVVNQLSQSDNAARLQQEQRRILEQTYGQNAVGGLANVFANPFQGLQAAGHMFGQMFRQLEMTSLLGQTLGLNRALFV